MAEIPFESFSLALESAKGTPEANPTHFFQLEGMINPTQSRNRKARATGTLAENHTSTITRRGSDWSASGDADCNTLPVLANLAVKAVSSPSTPSGATTARLWTFSPTMTSDDLAAATIWWGDPNVQVLQSSYNMLNDFTFTNDASSEDSAQIEVGGSGWFPSKVADPTLPAQSSTKQMIGQKMQVWIDTSSAIGTTAVTGRVISASHSLTNNINYKRLAEGPTSSLNFTRHGRNRRSLTTHFVMELFDMTEYDLFAAGTHAKVRVRHNGDLIESTFYYYSQFDTYGPLDFTGWNNNEGNRTVEFDVISEYNVSAGVDWAVAFQNAKATL